VRGSLAATALGALGVVYGDIGTSPLYALSQCVDFVAGKGVPVRTEEIVGVLSLIFWALTLVVSVKYLAVIMRADNQGEGGVLALLALLRVTPSDSMRAAESAPEAADGGAATAGDPAVAAAAERTRRRTRALAALGILGAALLYGDGMITPAISVLSAVEGLAVATDAFEPFVVPITVALLAGLFAVQRLGTAGVARFFGPTMLVWFVAIGGLGLAHVVGQEATHASVLWAVDPRWGVRFLARHGVHGFLVLGAVVLAITGAEALYADLGHFGARPIRAAWSAVVFPALVLNYFGQGALIIERGGLVRHPFFDLAPGWALYPLVVLSAIATIVASQALISGVFSLTQQAAQLGYAPRFAVVHTSSTARGQVYLPQVNAAMTAACIALVLGFRSSDALASAYGIAVTGTMSVTSVLFYAVARRRLGWPRWRAGALVAVFLLVDLSFLLANADKVASGGWFPIAVGIAVFTVMTTWRRGRTLLGQLQARAGRSAEAFFAEIAASPPARVPGTAIYLSTNTTGIPALLLHNVDANRVLHERVVLLTIGVSEAPWVRVEERVSILDMGSGFFRVLALFGFMEVPTIGEVLERCTEHGLPLDPSSAVFFVSRDSLLTTGTAAMARWRKRLFALVWRNVASPIRTFRIPPARVLEIGVQLEL